MRFPFRPWGSRSVATRLPGPAAPDRPRTRRLWPSRKRRQFTAEYRLRILEEADRCTQPGEVGRLLRREGLYSSHLTAWRKARRKGSLRELAAKKRGAKPAERNPLDAKVRALEAQGGSPGARVAHRAHDPGRAGKSCRAAGIEPRTRNALLIAVQPLAAQVGVAPACQALGVSRATFYRRQRSTPGHQQPRPTPARALCEAEREQILDVLAGPRASSTVRRRRSWRRCSTKAITCARSGRCIGSWPPISRSESGAISASIPSTPSPSWWPRRRTRPGPGTSPSCWGRPSGRTSTSTSCSTSSAATRSAWMVADRENSALAGRLIEETCHKQGVQPQVLTLHSDRGAPMTSKCTAQLLADLGVTRSLSRPQVSDDKPLLRGPVQDPEVPPRLPWPLPRHHRRDRLLPNVLPLVQHRTSPWRDRDAHPGRRASQSNPERAGAARADPSSRLDPSSRTLRSRGSHNRIPFPKPSGSTHL